MHTFLRKWTLGAGGLALGWACYQLAPPVPPAVVGPAWGALAAALALLAGKAWGEWRARPLETGAFIDLDRCQLKPEVVQSLPEHVARLYQAIPVAQEGDRLTVAMVDPLHQLALDDIRLITGLDVLAAQATAAAVGRALERFFPAPPPAPALDPMDEPPIVRVCNLIISQAINDGASAIHVEPQARSMRVRFRVDGVLHDVMTPPKHIQSPVISRLKAMACQDVAERRVTQFGRIHLNHAGRAHDLLVSTVPTVHGERVVMRIRPQSPPVMGLDRLGLSADVRSRLEAILDHQPGLVLVTGPCGSGLSTTLYSCLHRLNREGLNLLTVEDEVEHQIPGVNQVRCNWKAGLTCASLMRSSAQHDPDVLMVSEIRDCETARLSVEASEGARTVLGALHTGTAAGALTRLLEMGVEPFLCASSLRAVLAQRLVRVVCPECKQPDLVAGPVTPAFHGKGCEACRGTGYKGRTGVFELLVVSDRLRQALMRREETAVLHQLAVEEGMQTLAQDLRNKVLAGQTSLREFLKTSNSD